jgi:aromatic amino acid transport protein AroP
MWVTGMKLPVELIQAWLVLLYISYLLIKKKKS